MTSHPLFLFLKLSRPLFLVGAALLYALGAGIADYLGYSIDWGVYLIGQSWVTAMQLTVHYLNEFFDAPADADNLHRTLFSGGSGAAGEGGLHRQVPLWAAFLTLTIVASITTFMLSTGLLSPVVILVMVLIFLGSVFYSAPPFRLARSGYGELTASVIVANLVPALALLLQTGELHRLLPMSTFPLTALHLAMMLAFQLPDYANDLKHQKRALMIRLGWESGMTLHNLLILTGFAILGLAVLMGMPRFVALPAFLVFPLGLLQIWYLNWIIAGGKPNWNALTLNAVAIFAGFAYLLAFAFWTR